MATKNSQKKQWFRITYDTKSACLCAYFECTYNEFVKHFKRFDRKYSNVDWSYCDNPYN